MGATPRVLVIFAEGSEEMEVTITVDVLRRGGLDVVLAGLDGAEPVTCARKIRIVPDVALRDARGPFDAIVLPGGAEGSRRLADSAEVGRLLAERERDGALVGAICAAPIALARHGVFGGRELTSHPSVRDVVGAHGRWSDRRVVEDGILVTSQGPGTAFEFALALVERLAGAERAREVRAPMMLDVAS